jgi:hypothetical protein
VFGNTLLAIFGEDWDCGLFISTVERAVRLICEDDVKGYG